jgi:hypothetical protein
VCASVLCLCVFVVPCHVDKIKASLCFDKRSSLFLGSLFRFVLRPCLCVCVFLFLFLFSLDYSERQTQKSRQTTNQQQHRQRKDMPRLCLKKRTVRGCVCVFITNTPSVTFLFSSNSTFVFLRECVFLFEISTQIMTLSQQACCLCVFFCAVCVRERDCECFHVCVFML